MAKVRLDTVDPEDYEFKNWLETHNVKVLSIEFSPNGDADIEFQGLPWELSEMIDKFWFDSELKNFIEVEDSDFVLPGQDEEYEKEYQAMLDRNGGIPDEDAHCPPEPDDFETHL